VEVLDDVTADLIIRTLKEENVKHVVNLPEDSSVALTKKIRADGYFTFIGVTNEEQGVALAAGISLGGKKSIFITGAGLLAGTWALSLMSRVYRVPFLLLVSHRGSVGDRSARNVPGVLLDMFGKIMKPQLDVCEVSYVLVNEKAHLERAIRDAAYTSYEHQAPVAILLSGEILW
jgi:sulfopyruvate decarboxylase subunit alpha